MSVYTEELVRLAKDGSLLAFTALVERYQGRVFSLAFSLLNNRADAEDVTQDAFVEAYVGLRKLRSPALFGSWLAAIAKNKARSLLRSRGREMPMPYYELNSETEPESVNEYSSSLRETVLHSLKAIPEEQRLALVLYYLDGCSYQEFLAMPKSTVKGRIQGGRKRLREDFMSKTKIVLQEEKPDKELAVRILRKAVKVSKDAWQQQDYQKLLETCDQALSAMDSLPKNPKRQKTAYDVFSRMAKAKERLASDDSAALTCYQSALEVALELNDKEGWQRVVHSILCHLARRGDFAGLKGAADEFARRAAKWKLHEALAYLEATQLWRQEGRIDSSREGGFAWGVLTLTKETEGLTLGRSRTKPTDAPANTAIHMNCGAPSFAALRFMVSGPDLILPKNLKPGLSWEGEAPHFWCDHIGLQRTCVSTVESINDELSVAAGVFTDCLRIRSDFSVQYSSAGTPTDNNWANDRLSGKRYMWFARGVGLIRLLYLDKTTDLGVPTDVQLTRYETGEKRDTSWFPRKQGYHWTYEWLDRLPASFKREHWCVTSIETNKTHLSFSVTSSGPSKTQLKQMTKQSNDFLRHRNEPSLSRIGELSWAGKDKKRLTNLLKNAEKRGDQDLIHAISQRLIYVHLEAGENDEVAQLWERLLATLSRNKQKQRISLMVDYLGFLFGERQLERHAALASERLTALSEDGHPSSLVEAKAYEQMASYLIKENLASKLGGYRSGSKEFIHTDSAIGHGNSSSGTCHPMQCEATGFEPSLVSMGRWLLLPPRVGKEWSDSWNAGCSGASRKPVCTRVIEARRQKLKGPRCSFEDCLRVKSRFSTNQWAGHGESNAEQRDTDGLERVDWYARGVGLVKSEFSLADGRQFTVELVDWHLAGPPTRYPIPIADGNNWHYQWTDEEGRERFHEFWSLAKSNSEKAYLGFAVVEILGEG